MWFNDELDFNKELEHDLDGEYAAYSPSMGDGSTVTLDGEFSAKTLRRIADVMEQILAEYKSKEAE